jgi:putative heme-binding domain-containing protein
MKTMRPFRICFLITILATVTTGALAQHEYTASEVEVGRQQYAANCMRCHGPDGDMIANADIGHGKFRRASADDQLVQIIRNGIPNTAMAAQSNISDPNAKAIVGYLRSMASTAAAIAALPPGNAARGKGIYEGKGACATCHRIGDSGSRAGPDLSQIADQRRSVELQRSLLEPDAEIVPTNRFIKVVTKDGATMTGRLLNQDSFTLQILDAKDDRLKSFSKSNLREFSFADKSSMPSYKDKLNAQEIADLISYLGSLKGQAQ